MGSLGEEFSIKQYNEVKIGKFAERNSDLNISIVFPFTRLNFHNYFVKTWRTCSKTSSPIPRREWTLADSDTQRTDAPRVKMTPWTPLAVFLQFL